MLNRNGLGIYLCWGRQKEGADDFVVLPIFFFFSNDYLKSFNKGWMPF